MKFARLALLILLAQILTACGAGPGTPRTIDGVWNATLQNSDLSIAYKFSATLSQGTGSTVDVSAFGFTSSAPCFTAPLGQSATFSPNGNYKRYQTGPFGMSITTALMTQVENVLTLSGTRNADGTISGTWSLKGLGGCSAGSGPFTMTALTPL